MGALSSKPNPNIDIFDDDDRRKMNENVASKFSFETLFVNFKNEYLKDFTKRENDNKPYFESLLDNWEHQDVRPNISVLVIIASKCEVFDLSKNEVGNNLNDKNDINNEEISKNHVENKQKSSKRSNKDDNKTKENKARFYKNSMDITNGLFICHMLHNAFGIPLSQMLITTTQENIIGNDDEFFYYQNVVFAQIGKKNYKFWLDDELQSRIKLFSLNSITDKTFSNPNSHLFVFILDHGSIGKLGGNTYQSYIENLLHINCKHFYVFNDSCYSSLMVEIIRFSIEFEKIFSNHLKSQLATTLINFLSTLDVVEPHNFFNCINSKLDSTEDLDIIQYKSDIKSVLKLAFEDHKTQHNLINLVKILVTSLSGIFFDPNIFINFGHKATIFASSIYRGIDLTLPVRRIHVFDHTQYRVCGSIFTSIYIESLLSAPNSLGDFINSIKLAFPKYKEEFESYILQQNEKKEQEINSSIASVGDIINFFKIMPDDSFHFFSLIDIWPDFQSILTNNKYWNVDVSMVNSKEYENIHLGELLVKSFIHHYQIDSNIYGPIKTQSRLYKFLHDFEKAVGIELHKNKIFKEFTIDIDENDCIDDYNNKEIPYKLGLSAWGEFYYYIDPYIISNLSRGVMELKRPITKFFSDNLDLNSLYVINIFCKAYKIIFQYWKYHSL